MVYLSLLSPEQTIFKLKEGKDLFMTEKDFYNIEQVQRILKYIDKGKFDVDSWKNTLELNQSINKLLEEHKELSDHMKQHH